jgi:hypothetical protein
MTRRRRQPEPVPTNFARQAQFDKRQRIERLLTESRAQLPPWHFLAPWEAERHIEGLKQATLDFDNSRPH